MNPKLSHIEQLPKANYEVNVDWVYLERWLESQQQTGDSIDLSPDFQPINAGGTPHKKSELHAVRILLEAEA